MFGSEEPDFSESIPSMSSSGGLSLFKISHLDKIWTLASNPQVLKGSLARVMGLLRLLMNHDRSTNLKGFLGSVFNLGWVSFGGVYILDVYVVVELLDLVNGFEHDHGEEAMLCRRVSMPNTWRLILLE